MLDHIFHEAVIYISANWESEIGKMLDDIY